MKFKSPVYSSVSGSIAGLTYSHNRGGLYTRARAVPTNPNTSAQQSARNAFASLVALWQTLTSAQRDAWNTYAENVTVLSALGDPLTLTGQQMYIRCNSPRLRVGLDRVDDGPTTYSMGSFTPVIVQANEATPMEIEVQFTNTDEWAVADGGALIVQTSMQKPPTVNFHKAPFVFAGIIEGNTATPPTSPVTIDSPFPGNVTNFVFNRVRATLPDGRLSAVQITRDEIL